MRFTFRPPQEYSAFPMSTLQIFSLKVAGIKRESGLQWLLDVFGTVAVRDSIDYNRNIIFSSTRKGCQTVTKEDPYLVLAGPTRAVVWQDFLAIEVKLKVKGTTESEDKDLSYLAVPLACSQASNSYGFQCYKTSQSSTLRFALGHIVRSVEATIFVQVAEGSWPDGLCGQFDAFTTGIHDESVTGIDHEKITLLDSKAKKVLVNGDGEIMLSRRVVSVETPRWHCRRTRPGLYPKQEQT
ncbi:hypothetical protein EJB05_12648 [Eragrostis curvula]|uniref:DUF6598 domain-containing protein n=1 Tax=Eragrostis curvula TaxID=38414 RepID=A0A5J9VSW0_9POAL|nr:hypothetical protein EJB05_12648 [Eragrostis curvula]